MEEFFYKHPVFRRDELIDWKVAQGASVSAAKAAVSYYLKQSRIVSIKRGLYVSVPPGELASSIVPDSYLVASKASHKGILSYHTALELHGVAYSNFEYLYFVTPEKIRPFEFLGRFYQPVTSPGGLANDAIEVETINRQGLEIKITSLSRTFVDVLDRVELSGSWEEVMRSLDSIGALNIDKVIAYCLQLGHPILAAKVGYVLEQRSGVFAPTEEQINQLLLKKPKQPVYVSGARKEVGKLCKKWNLMLPESVYKKSWEEPNYDI